TVAMQRDVLGQERDEFRLVTAAGRFGKALQQRAMALAVHIETWPFLAHARPGAAEDLATGDRIAPNHGCDLPEGEIESIAQHEHDALQWGEPLEYGDEGERHVGGVDSGLGRGDERLGQPFAHIGLPSRPLVAQAVEAQPRGNGRQIRLERAHFVARGSVVQPQERVLDDLLGVGPVTRDPVGQGEHGRTQLGKGSIESHLRRPMPSRHARKPKRDLCPGSCARLSRPAAPACLVGCDSNASIRTSCLTHRNVIDQRRRVQVLDSEISFVDTGLGDPIVFLHGNPTSSYLWRNIIPHVSGLGRCLAPDLVGMGSSARSPRQAYRFMDHAAYLDAWFEALGLTENVILVAHDWGSVLGFHRAFRYPRHFKAIAYMEAIALPLRWEDFGEAAEIFQALRSDRGERMIFEDNFFVERILPGSVIRKLAQDEMAAYRRPFLERESRLPTLVWPRQIPIEGEPADVNLIVERCGKWLSKSELPKLLVLSDPGAIMRGRSREFCRSWPNQREIIVKGRHFLHEDSPEEIGRALAEFVRELAGSELQRAASSAGLEGKS